MPSVLYVGVNSFTANNAIQGDMGWISSKYRRHRLMLKLWNHILHLDVNRLPRKIFEWDYSAVRSSWSSEVENILEDLNLTHVFEDKIVCDLNECETQLRDNECREWESEVQSKPKLRMYVTFKYDLATESYVKIFLSKHKRSVLAQFRSGNTAVKDWTGRFRQWKPEEKSVSYVV